MRTARSEGFTSCPFDPPHGHIEAMATVACKCGEKFHPSPEHFGKEVRCRKCGRTVKLIPDPKLDPPPRPKQSGFTQTFTDSAPGYAAPSYSAPPPPQPQEPPFDPNAPRGLHPEVRRILIYVGAAAFLLAAALIFSVLKGNKPREPETRPDGSMPGEGSIEVLLPRRMVAQRCAPPPGHRTAV
jgi:hypothetical protein